MYMYICIYVCIYIYIYTHMGGADDLARLTGVPGPSALAARREGRLEHLLCFVLKKSPLS